MALSVTFNGLTVHGTDGNGVKWHTAEIVGWDGEDVRGEVLTAPGVAGGFAGEWVASPWALSLVGHADAPTASAMLVALEALMAARKAAITAEVALVVNRGAGNQTMQVRTAPGRPMVKILTDKAFQYEVPLIALSPVKT